MTKLCLMCDAKLIKDTDEVLDFLVCERYYDNECDYIEVVEKDQTA